MRFAASLVGPDRASDLVSEVMVATLQQPTPVVIDRLVADEYFRADIEDF